MATTKLSASETYSKMTGGCGDGFWVCKTVRAIWMGAWRESGKVSATMATGNETHRRVTGCPWWVSGAVPVRLGEIDHRSDRAVWRRFPS